MKLSPNVAHVWFITWNILNNVFISVGICLIFGTVIFISYMAVTTQIYPNKIFSVLPTSLRLLTPATPNTHKHLLEENIIPDLF